MSYKVSNFVYDESTLSGDQIAQIERAKSSCERRLAELQKEEDERMQRYYDCVDDYSWGGPCSKANAVAQDRVKFEFREAVEMIVRGGFVIRKWQENILREIGSGDVVAEGTHDGKYGRYFTLKDGKGYVSCSKRVQTYEKKGYRPYIRTTEHKLVPRGWWRYSGERKYDIIEKLGTTEEVSTEIVY